MKAEKLKASILQQAIQGKLVSQNESDEPASVLIEKIKAEKIKLLEEKKIKKEKPLPPIAEEEKPFELPNGWEWVRLGEIGFWKAGSTPNRSKSIYYNGKINWIKTGELNDGYVNESNEKITDIALKECSLNLNEKDSVLIAMYGATIGKLGILTSDATTNQACCACKPIFINNLYVFYFLLSQRDNFKKMGVGGAQPNISREKIINYYFPVPPLEEQIRIVEKLDLIMPLINEYEKLEKELTLLDGSLKDKLKSSLLQEAIQGKLVAQEESDEPASVLIEKIKAEKIKKEKPLPPITEEEKPFELPKGWEWVRFADIMLKVTDGAHTTPKYVANGVPFLSVKDMSSGKLDFSDTKFISEDEHKELFKRCNPELGDVLVTKIGTTGIPVIVDTEREFSLFVSVALLKFNQNLLYNKFLFYLINTPLVKQLSKDNTRGVGNKNLVLKDLKNFPIPLPPLEEQKRIVEKLDKLMALCDEL